MRLFFERFERLECSTSIKILSKIFQKSQIRAMWSSNTKIVNANFQNLAKGISEPWSGISCWSLGAGLPSKTWDSGFNLGAWALEFRSEGISVIFLGGAGRTGTMFLLGCVGLAWVALCWAGLGWLVLGWAGLAWAGLAVAGCVLGCLGGSLGAWVPGCLGSGDPGLPKQRRFPDVKKLERT